MLQLGKLVHLITKQVQTTEAVNKVYFGTQSLYSLSILSIDESPY